MLKSKGKAAENAATETLKDEGPAIIDEIAGGVSDWYEYAMEYIANQYDEDDKITDLLMMNRAGNYTEAVRLLRLVFSIMEMEPAMALISLIHDSKDDKREEFFMKAFMERSSKCRFRAMFEGAGDPAAGEEQ